MLSGVGSEIPGTPSRPRVLRHLGLLAGAFVALFAWTWGTWPDVLVDFGTELYVPWRLTEGAHLYSDIAWYKGPLSPHWNALLFLAFGTGLSTLVWANAIVFAAILALLHALLRAFSTWTAATAACLAVMALCGFGQLVGVANYNYICPYTHEATHGMLLGLGVLAALGRWSPRRRLGWILTAGVLAGLSFLAKPEMFVAAMAGATALLALSLRREPRGAKRDVALFVAGLVLPVAAAWLLLSTTLPAAASLRATLGSWPAIGSSPVSGLPFYRSGMGIDAPGANLRAMAAWALGIAAFFAPALLLARYFRRSDRAAAVLAALSALAALYGLHRRVAWIELARPWPLFALAALLVAGRGAWRERTPRAIAATAFAAFSLALLAKMALNARIAHYGFVLAMPATALLVIAALDWLPEALARRGFRPAAVRAGAAAAILGVCLIHLDVVALVRANKRVEVGAGNDRLLADGRGQVVRSALAWLEKHRDLAKETPTLVVVPEGVMLNYLARLENPTPFVLFTPLETMLFGDRAMIEALAARPPDLLLVTHRNFQEFGSPWFGRTYAAAVGEWIERNYETAELFGDSPMEPGSRFGIRAMRRRAPRAE